MVFTVLNYIYKLRSKLRKHFASLKHVNDLRVYQGFIMMLNHQVTLQGTLKQF